MKRAGFTLLELMTVMVIMFILMGMGTVAMRGVTRGAGARGATDLVKSALLQARQTAIMQRKDVYVIFRSANGENGISAYAPYAVCQSYAGRNLVTTQDLPWPTGTLVNASIYNLTESKRDRKVVSTIVEEHTTKRRLKCASDSGQWSSGEIVGFEMNTEIFLPDTTEFVSLPDPIVFQSSGGTADGDATIQITEKNVAGSTPTEIKVDGLTGWVN